jgi:hypothetical protein
VIHGDLDVCQHVERGRAFAELTGGDLVVIEGAGHLTLVRDPVKVNRAIMGFVDQITAASGSARWLTGRRAPWSPPPPPPRPGASGPTATGRWETPAG